MNRNGKAPHGAAATLTLLGTPSEPPPMAFEAAGAPSEPAATALATAGTPSSAAGTPSELIGTLSSAAGTPSDRRVASFDANASIARRLAAAQLAIEAVLADADLQATLAAYGYDAARMREGQALRERALALHQQQRARYGALYGATDARAAAQTQAHASYMRHLGVARVALRGDRAAAQTLGLAGKRQTRQADWLLQAQQFYANTLADAAILGALAGYKLTEAQLAAGYAQVRAVAGGAVAQQSSKGAAREATQARDAALGALNRWMRDFLAIARIALAEQPRRLEQIGVRVVS